MPKPSKSIPDVVGELWELLKAYAPGYTAAAQWTTVYDAQKAKLVDGQTTFEVTLALTPQ